MQSNIPRAGKFARKIKGIGRMTEYVGFAGHVATFDVAMFYSTRTPENAAVRPASPCLARALGARSVSRYLSIREATATFPVRVMRSKLGETSREATYVSRRTPFYAETRGARAIVSKKKKERVNRSSRLHLVATPCVIVVLHPFAMT